MKKLVIGFGVLLAFLIIPICVAGVLPFEKGFIKITPNNGFGDDQNNYAWGMTEFQNCIYVGTSRNVPYYVGLQLKLGELIPWELEIPDVSHPGGSPPPPFGPSPPPYTPDPDDTETWSEDMSAEIWRYCDSIWEKVHTAPTFTMGPYTYPEGTGYRYLITYTDGDGSEAVYAGVGTGFGNTLLWKSETGESLEWCKVKFDQVLQTGSYDTRAMTVHNGKLYIGLGIGTGGVFGTDDPNCETDTWDDTGFPGGAVGAMKSYNGHLYVITWEGAEGAFEVWRSTVADPEEGSDWVRVVAGGAGDLWNSFGADIETFKGDLYVGSMSLPLTYGPGGVGLRNPKGFDLIRIDEEDNWDLIIGDYNIPAERVTSTTSQRGLPLSGWPAGFGNPFNFYNWQLEEHNGLLYLTSFDASSFLRVIPDELTIPLLTQLDQSEISSRVSDLQSSGIDDEYTEQMIQALQQTSIMDIIKMLGEMFGGADMWVSSDGIHWVPVELNGFDNPNNYGFRTLLSTDEGLYVGTANPFQGLEVWRGKAQTAYNLVTTPDGCYFDVDPKQSGQQFKLIFTPDVPDNPTKYRLTASNPGQFGYNAFFIGQLDAGESITVQLPYPFVTQGANPVHVYSGLKLGDNKCFVLGKDITSQFTISGVPVVLDNGNGYDGFGQFASITVEANDEYNGFAWIVVHGDYGLKKLVGDLTKSVNNAIGTITITNDYPYTFSVTAPISKQITIENLNVFKRDPGFVGLVTDAEGNPVSGVQVQIFGPTGVLLKTITTDNDGWYTYNYKYTGKAAIFTLTLLTYDITQTVTMKSNSIVKTDFQIP